MPSPADNAAYQAAGLALLSNVIAQFIVSYQSQASCSRKGKKRAWVNQYAKQTPFQLDTTALVQFVVFAYLSTPPNYHWQIALERWFPGYHMTNKQEEKTPSREVQETKKLNVRNTVIKFLLDQIVGGTANTIVFIAAFAAFNKRNILEACINQFWDMRVASLKLWPAVNSVLHLADGS